MYSFVYFMVLIIWHHIYAYIRSIWRGIGSMSLWICKKGWFSVGSRCWIENCWKSRRVIDQAAFGVDWSGDYNYALPSWNFCWKHYCRFLVVDKSRIMFSIYKEELLQNYRRFCCTPNRTRQTKVFVIMQLYAVKSDTPYLAGIFKFMTHKASFCQIWEHWICVIYFWSCFLYWKDSTPMRLTRTTQYILWCAFWIHHLRWWISASSCCHSFNSIVEKFLQRMTWAPLERGKCLHILHILHIIF